MKPNILYLCDRKKKCNVSEMCGHADEYGNGCIYTIDPEHAKNGPVKNQRELDERFDHYIFGRFSYWMERNNGTKNYWKRSNAFHSDV